MIKIINILFITLFFSSICFCEEFFPKDGIIDKFDPIASPDAETGGEISVYAGPYPKSLNYYLHNSAFSGEFFGEIYETLLATNSITLEYEPALAEKWSISDDKKTFTFYINKKAKWSDGVPITSLDVKWTFDAIIDSKNLTGPHKVAMEVFEEPKIIDKQTIKFTAKEVHWRNLGACGGFSILPKHVYEGKDFNKINFEFPVVSGRYKLGDISEGIYITIKRRNDYWNIKAKSCQGVANFDTMKFIFFAERENAFDAFKKGLIDLFPIYTAHLWVKRTTGEQFTNNWIIKQKIYNSKPVGFQGFAMNMRKPPFDDIRVRQAMAFLLDRKKMNSALMYSQYFLHKSYYEDLFDKETPCPNTFIDMDKTKARELLKDAGFIVNPKTGFLEKDGKKFSFRFLNYEASSEKFLNIYSEDLKDVGIELIIDKKDWSAWAKDMDEFNFEMTWAAWSSGVFKDPEGMWASKEAERKSGTNITGFKDERVDQLIEDQKSIFDVSKRKKICREIDKIVYEKYPYVLLWNNNYIRLLYWNKFGTPSTVLSKYGDESSAYWYWWIDKDSYADLYDSMDKKLPLPQKASSIYFEDIFKTYLR
ncbi:MAG: ABC transporter substrate-binding protein [Desulfobacterales bacterium]|nr:ABC transporter substrate-binding protein [Desulfobacterales bacterium]